MTLKLYSYCYYYYTNIYNAQINSEPQMHSGGLLINLHTLKRLPLPVNKSVPETSVPSERQFSAAGRLVSKLRSRLDPERVDMLIFLYENLELCAVDSSSVTY